jgi:hypothetical protein
MTTFNIRQTDMISRAQQRANREGGYTMRCMGYAGKQGACPFLGQYLEWYNPDADETGDLGGWTADRARAKTFETFEDAMDEWMRVRQVNGGLRPDGHPNRPLTAFSVTIERIVP